MAKFSISRFECSTIVRAPVRTSAALVIDWRSGWAWCARSGLPAGLTGIIHSDILAAGGAHGPPSPSRIQLR